MWDVLPSGVRELSKERIVEVEAFIADDEEFPATKLEASLFQTVAMSAQHRIH
jgi:hypothetical protein